MWRTKLSRLERSYMLIFEVQGYINTPLKKKKKEEEEGEGGEGGGGGENTRKKTHKNQSPVEQMLFFEITKKLLNMPLIQEKQCFYRLFPLFIGLHYRFTDVIFIDHTTKF